MIEDTETAGASAPPSFKKRAVGFKIKMALLEIIERKRLSDRVDYKAVAARHDTTSGSLRRTYSMWKRGEIDLGDPETPEEKQIDGRMQHEKTLALLRRYKGLILQGFESALFRAEDAQTNGEKDSWKLVSPILKELKSVTDIQVFHEKGYASILEDMLASRQRAEKQLGAPTINVETETKILHASDEERAMHALGMIHGSELHHETSAGVPAQDRGGD